MHFLITKWSFRIEIIFAQSIVWKKVVGICKPSLYIKKSIYIDIFLLMEVLNCMLIFRFAEQKLGLVVYQQLLKSSNLLGSLSKLHE